jgi:hypothetical protein
MKASLLIALALAIAHMPVCADELYERGVAAIHKKDYVTALKNLVAYRYANIQKLAGEKEFLAKLEANIAHAETRLRQFQELHRSTDGSATRERGSIAEMYPTEPPIRITRTTAGAGREDVEAIRLLSERGLVIVPTTPAARAALEQLIKSKESELTTLRGVTSAASMDRASK